MLDANGYDFEAATIRILASRLSAARAMCPPHEEGSGGFAPLCTVRASADENLRTRSIAQARLLQEIGEAEEECDLIARAGDALY